LSVRTPPRPQTARASPPGQESRQRARPAGLEHQLQPVEREPHRRHDLAVGDQHDVVDQPLHDGEGELAGDIDLLAVRDGARHAISEFRKSHHKVADPCRLIASMLHDVTSMFVSGLARHDSVFARLVVLPPSQ